MDAKLGTFAGAWLSGSGPFVNVKWEKLPVPFFGKFHPYLIRAVRCQGALQVRSVPGAGTCTVARPGGPADGVNRVERASRCSSRSFPGVQVGPPGLGIGEHGLDKIPRAILNPDGNDIFRGKISAGGTGGRRYGQYAVRLGFEAGYGEQYSQNDQGDFLHSLVFCCSKIKKYI